MVKTTDSSLDSQLILPTLIHRPYSHAGAEISKQLAAKGCKVAVNYAFSEDRAKGTLDSLAGSGHVLIQGDAFDRESVKRIADEAVAKLGGVDIVISNAGWTTFAPFDDLREWCDMHLIALQGHKLTV